jgi:uncharacterized membrane protein (UPF0127 family)
VTRDREGAARRVAATLRAVHRESGRTVAARVVVAATFVRRLSGWIGRRPASDEGLWLPRCACIHTAGLRIAIDLIWRDPCGVIRRVDRSVRPWRVVAVQGAADVCEVPEDGAAGLVPGDHLDLVADTLSRSGSAIMGDGE